jgi:CHASE1-domain containing sensor protein
MASALLVRRCSNDALRGGIRRYFHPGQKLGGKTIAAGIQMRSQQLADSVKASLQEQSLFLDQLSSAFVNRRDAVSAGDFHGLVEGLLRRFPMIQAVEWAPKIAFNERDAFERSRQQDLPGFEVRERGESGEMRAAGARREYYPVTCLEPTAGNEPATGFDLASNASRKAAIDNAVRSDSLIANEPVALSRSAAKKAVCC